MNKMKKLLLTLVSMCLAFSCVALSGCATIETLISKLTPNSEQTSTPEEGAGESDKEEGNQPNDENPDSSSIGGICEHTLVKLPWRAPTCLQEGKKGGFQCSTCKKIFTYSSEKDGLIEVSEQETIAKSNHVLGDEYSVRLKEGISKATSFADFEIVSNCDLCGTGFTVASESLKAFAPSTKVLYDDKTVVNAKREQVDGLVSTTYTFPSSTLPNMHNWVYHNNDSGELNANTKVPFTANTDRYILMFVKNNSSLKVTFKYGAEYWSNYCWSDAVTVEGNSYTAFVLKLNFNGSDYACYHTIQLLASISKEVRLTFSGYYVV
ncbi:MAG: hypothetical protein IJW96_04065 [Clostridia bacterium]|nr:hypothetical protein [Clostridia bacterium]